ncbi:Type 1 glutamine amidotransferase-like domain-containing protein [Bacillus sp. LL01]|nr:Type 1 glutamine amidotransferase-like domain-containing protein [Bacillus sp. LL01]
MKKDLPQVLFVPTASRDQSNYIERFYKAFKLLPCKPSHLLYFMPNEP